MFEYKTWADNRTIDAVQKIPIPQTTESNFARQQLNHMIIVEELFRSRISREQDCHNVTNTKELPALSCLKQRLMSSNEWYLDFLTQCVDLDEKIYFTFVDGKPGCLSIDEILFHVINHGSYHRGNIAHALDNAGVPHPVDGYPKFIHETQKSRRQKRWDKWI
ncbi:MAG: damage-inducible protein DinB [Alteromonadaceae bacterium]|nr:damage-inducible protein DinB [Alteromonadaceae bacterium]